MEIRKLLLDFLWFIFPDWLGNIIAYISGGWILAKCYYPDTNKIVAYRLVCHNDEIRSVTLWEEM